MTALESQDKSVEVDSHPRNPKKPATKRSKRKPEMKFVVVKEGELSPEGVERIARILFEWWRRDFEKASTDKAGSQ